MLLHVLTTSNRNTIITKSVFFRNGIVFNYGKNNDDEEEGEKDGIIGNRKTTEKIKLTLHDHG